MLIHYVLDRNGLTPEEFIFPVSAVMERRRAAYDAVLEAFSVPLMRLLDYDVDEDDSVAVTTDSQHHYRFFDATPMAEALCDWIEATIHEDFLSELKFLEMFRRVRQAVDDILEMPDAKAELFIRLCMQNQGTLSSKKRKLFGFLSDDEIRELEGVVQAHWSEQGQGMLN